MDMILIGAPGAGKGTQAEKLSQLLGVQHIASGDLFRKAFEEQSELALKAQRYVDLGELVPDELTIPTVLRHVEEPESMHGVLLDGFPRTLAQAQALDAHQHVYHVNLRPPKVADTCDLDGSKLYQRPDDTGEALRRRLVIFFNEATPVLDYYRKQHKLRKVDGNQSIDQVQAMLLNEINDSMRRETKAQ